MTRGPCGCLLWPAAVWHGTRGPFLVVLHVDDPPASVTDLAAAIRVHLPTVTIVDFLAAGVASTFKPLSRGD